MSEHGGNVWQAARERGAAVSALIDFSASLNPLGPPAAVWRVLAAPEALVRHYPEPLAPAVRAAVARWRGVPESAVLVTNGAAEALYLLARLAAGRRTRWAEPTFSEYRRAAAAAGSRPDPVVLRPLPSAPGGLLSPEDARGLAERLAAGLERGDLALLCNPNNPTGWLVDGAAVRSLAATLADRGCWLVVDESFIDFAPEPRRHSVGAQAAAAGGRLAVVGSLTKLFGMPGLRVGYAVAPPEVVRRLDAARDPWSVGGLAQAAAVATLAAPGFVARTRRWIARERPRVAAGLARLAGMAALPSAANFHCVRLTRGSGPSLRAFLGARGLLVRDGATFPGLGPAWLRAAVRSRPENDALLEALAEWDARSA